MAEVDDEFLARIFGAAPTTAADAHEPAHAEAVQPTGIGLGTGLGLPPAKPADLQFEHVLKELLSAEEGVRRAVHQLGIKLVVERLVADHGRKKILAAVKKVGREPLSVGYYISRHGFALICERYGCRGDRAAATQLRQFLSNRCGELRSIDAIYRRLREARRRCDADPLMKAAAERFADSYASEGHGKPLPEVLRSLTRRWTNTPLL
jgi:hypothetical protein